MRINIKSNQTPGNTLASRTMNLNFVNILVCIWLASDWFNNTQLLSELTLYAHYREPVPLNYLEKLSFFGRWKTLSAASEIMQETHLCDYRISKFSGQACPQIPPARRALPILCPGVKLSCPSVQNFKETPARLCMSYTHSHKGAKITWFWTYQFWWINYDNAPSKSEMGAKSKTLTWITND